MKLRSDLHVYGVGMKGWIEVRVGKVLPKAHTTSIQKTIILTVEDRDRYDIYREDGRWVHPTKQVKRKITLTNTVWEGGRAIGGMRAKRFKNYTGVGVANGQVKLVPPSRISTLLRELEHA
jgi:hypothetical protein